jgi:hypothetical protein
MADRVLSKTDLSPAAVLPNSRVWQTPGAVLLDAAKGKPRPGPFSMPELRSGSKNSRCAALVERGSFPRRAPRRAKAKAKNTTSTGTTPVSLHAP